MCMNWVHFFRSMTLEVFIYTATNNNKYASTWNSNVNAPVQSRAPSIMSPANLAQGVASEINQLHPVKALATYSDTTD
jgi:hypothetical protein